MPIYEYQCNHCDHQLEALQKISDAPLLACPACGQDALQKKISVSAFRLKGGGWYETDFKTGNKKNLAGAGDAKPDSANKTDTSAKTDAGAASKPPAA